MRTVAIVATMKMKTNSVTGPQSFVGPRGVKGAGRGVMALVAFGCVLPLTAGAASHHKRVKPVVDIMAQGTVVDHAKAPLTNAIVYLENPKSLAIKSYLTDEHGNFHFTALSPQTDYEIWAEKNGVQSKHQFISQFSSHTHFDFTLRLDPNHKHKLFGFI